MKYLSFCFFIPMLFLNSCVKPLNVQTQYIGRESLASSFIDTPDPKLENPDEGQRLVIEWNLPPMYMLYEDLHMEIRVRFKNRQERQLDLKLNTPSGVYLYPILNEFYKETRGLLTYKVDIVGDGCILQSWKHPLWVELIRFGEG